MNISYRVLYISAAASLRNKSKMDLQRSDSIIRSSKGYREYVNSQSNLEPFDIEDVFEDDASDILDDFDISDAFEETGNFLDTSNLNNNNNNNNNDIDRSSNTLSRSKTSASSSSSSCSPSPSTSNKPLPRIHKEKATRLDKTIGPSNLTERDAYTFRIALLHESKLRNAHVWQLFYNDLKIIGFVKHENNKIPYEKLESLSMTSFVTSNNIYRDVIGHLPGKYAAFLAIFRFICYVCYRNDDCANNNILTSGGIPILNGKCRENIVNFFRKYIVPVKPLEREKDIQIEDVSDTKKLRINLSVDFETKTWRPTVHSSMKLPAINSCRTINKGNEKLFQDLPQSSYMPKNKYFIFTDSKIVTKATDISVNTNILAEYRWKNDGKKNKLSVAWIRILMIRQLYRSAELCALFSAKQLYGIGDLFEQQCKLINTFIKNELYMNVTKKRKRLDLKSTTTLKKNIGPRFQGLKFSLENFFGISNSNVTGNIENNIKIEIDNEKENITPLESNLTGCISDKHLNDKAATINTLKSVKQYTTIRNEVVPPSICRFIFDSVFWECFLITFLWLDSSILTKIFEQQIKDVGFHKFINSGLGYQLVPYFIQIMALISFSILSFNKYYMVYYKERLISESTNNKCYYMILMHSIFTICYAIYIIQTRSGSCVRYPCYSHKSLNGSCIPLSRKLIPFLPAEYLSHCYAFNTTESPTFCGVKYCNEGWNTCASGGGVNNNFLGFPIDRVEEFEGINSLLGIVMQGSCENVFFIFTFIFGYLRIATNSISTVEALNRLYFYKNINRDGKNTQMHLEGISKKILLLSVLIVLISCYISMSNKYEEFASSPRRVRVYQFPAIRI